MRSWTSWARWNRVSSSSSASVRRRKRRCSQDMHFSFLCGIHDATDRAGNLFPAGKLGGKLLPAGGGQAVVFGPLVVLGHLPLGPDPALLFEAMKRRVERTMFDLQHVLGAGADGKSD